MTKDAQEYRDLITFMLTEPAFKNANAKYLRSIRKKIDDIGVVTSRQKTSIQNIYKGFTR